MDENIEKSARSDKSGIRFIIKFSQKDSPDGFTVSSRNQFSYDMFVNWSWEKLREYQYWPVDDLFSRPNAFKV